MRAWALSALVTGSILFTAGVRAETEGESPEDKIYEEKKAAAQAKLLAEHKEMFNKLEQTKEQLKTTRAEVFKPGTASITIDEETKPVAEPATIEEALDLKTRVRDEYEISPDDFKIDEHDRWSINLSDFRFDQPQYISSDIRQGTDKTWFGFTFTITNPTPKPRRISPTFVACTNKGVFNQSVGGLVPERILADSLGRPLPESEDLHDKELASQNIAPLESALRLSDFTLDPATGKSQLSPLATFQPGQTRWGAALWSNFSNEFTELKVVVHGLCNSHRYDEKMRRVLVLTFERMKDEFNVQRAELKYKDKRWEYLWMWDQDISVPIPSDAKDPQIKAQKLTTPAGAEKLAWAFPFVIKNSTRANQDIAVMSVAFACNIEVDVGGAKVPVEVRVTDDGRSTIYKTQLLKGLGKESVKDRYLSKTFTDGSKTQAERNTVTLESGKSLDENWAVFDESDVDWDFVKLQIESALTEKVDKKALAKQTWEDTVKRVAPDDKDLAGKNPGILYDPRRRLTDDEFTQVKEQVSKALPAAVDAAKSKKTVVAYFNCISGLSSGTYRISRSYRQPGVVDESWLKAWEELDKAP